MIPYVLTVSEEEEQLARGIADVQSLEVARVYAEALLNAAEKAGQAEEVLAEFEALLQTIEAPRSVVRKFLASGVISRETRGEAIRKAFDGRAHPILVDFLLVVNDHERMPLLPAILFEARELRDRRARRLPVHVTSAMPLPDDQLEGIKDAVRKRLRWEPLLETKIDPELLGGVQLRIGDWLFDSSIRTQLNEMRKELIERSSHEIQSGRDRFSSANGN